MDIKQLSTQIHRRSALFETVLRACQELLDHLPEAEQARTYADTRFSTECQQHFEIGFFPSDQQLHHLIAKVGDKVLKELGLIYNSYPYNINRGVLACHNLVIPYRDDYGNIVSLIGRSILSEEELKANNSISPDNTISKYKYTSNFSKSLHLFGLNLAKKEIRRTGTIIIVEGQIDCITCHGAGITNAVALGGSNFSRHQFYLANKYADNICLLLDNDRAGFKGERKFKHNYQKYSTIKKLFLPEEYKDVDQYLKENKNDNIFKELNER